MPRGKDQNEHVHNQRKEIPESPTPDCAFDTRFHRTHGSIFLVEIFMQEFKMEISNSARIALISLPRYR